MAGKNQFSQPENNSRASKIEFGKLLGHTQTVTTQRYAHIWAKQ
jgi:hypothetical protein